MSLALHTRQPPTAPMAPAPGAAPAGTGRGPLRATRLAPRRCGKPARSRDSVLLEPHSPPRTTGHQRAASAPRVCERKTPPAGTHAQAHSAGAITPPRPAAAALSGRAGHPRGHGAHANSAKVRPRKGKADLDGEKHRGPAGHANRPRTGPVGPTLTASVSASCRCRLDVVGRAWGRGCVGAANWRTPDRRWRANRSYRPSPPCCPTGPPATTTRAR